MIVADRADFPTDRYVVEGLAAARGLEIRWLDGDPSEGWPRTTRPRRSTTDVALVLLSLVSYRSSAIVDLDAVEAAARSAGAHVVWDLSHAAGAIPVDLAARDVGLAVGCTYKYLFGGPGAPAFLYVHPRLQDRLRPPVQGWFAQRDQFAMGPSFERRPGIEGWLAGTPPILAPDGGGGGGRGRRRGRHRGDPGEVRGADGATRSSDWTPTSRRSVARSAARAIRPGAAATSRSAIPMPGRWWTRLMARGVITDFREPDVIRFGLSPLTTSFADVDRGVAALRRAAQRPVGPRRVERPPQPTGARCSTRIGSIASAGVNPKTWPRNESSARLARRGGTPPCGSRGPRPRG